MVLGALATIGAGLPSGFLFGTGYGAGVRFGYEDVYPYLKGNMSQIANLLNIPFASSGFKLASGVTEKQGMGLHGVDTIGKQDQFSVPELSTPAQSPSGQPMKQRIDVPYGSYEHWTNVLGFEKHGSNIIVKRNAQDVVLYPNT